MNRLWVFGDSFSHFLKNVCSEYADLFKYEPQIYSQTLAKDLNVDLVSLAKGGFDNYSIFYTWVGVLDEIMEGDILIFGWTQQERFRMVCTDDEWMTININHFDRKKQIRNVGNFNRKTCDQMLLNRSHERYTEEINDFIKVINFSMKNNLVIHWSWVNYEGKVNLTLPYKELDNISTETNGKILDGHYGQTSHKILADIIKGYILKKQNTVLEEKKLI